jgi:hypothetical protein
MISRNPDYDSAMALFKKESKTTKPLVYNIHNSKLVYSAMNGSGIAKGTCFKDIVFPNLYRVDQYVNGQKITSYRCGMTNRCKSKDLKVLVKTINNNRKPLTYRGQKKEDKLIVISLLGYCTTRACSIVKKLAKTNILPDAVTDSINEDSIISEIQETTSLLPLFVPIRPQSIKVAGFTIKLSKDRPEARDDDDPHYKIMNDMISMNNAKSVFRSIVNIAEYYYGIKDRYNLLVACRSGKDRTTIVDAIVRATFNCLMTKRKVDYEYIRKTSKEFINPGLVIAYFSTGAYGLKIKQLSLAHYILSNKEISSLNR